MSFYLCAVLFAIIGNGSFGPVPVTSFQQLTGLAFSRLAWSSSNTPAKISIKASAAASDNYNAPLLDLGNLVEGTVVKRPSATIKSPYVADVRLADTDSHELALAHAPALDVGGLCLPGAIVLMKQRHPGGKTSHSIELVLADDPHGRKGTVLVGAHPRLGEELAEQVLRRGLLEECIGFGAVTGEVPKGKVRKSPKKKQNERKTTTDEDVEIVVEPGTYIQRQITYGDSRIDFELVAIRGADDESYSRALIEVKNIVCADYFAEHAPEKKSNNHCVVIAPEKNESNYERTALFPWGRCRQEFEGQKVVSARAIKHIRNLVGMESKEVRPVVLFVVNRSDCDKVRACSEACSMFAKELAKASQQGVCVVAFRVRWSRCGKAYFDGVLPINL